MNKFIGIGRLTRDPELKYTTSGVAFASFTLALDGQRKNSQGEKETTFIPCVVWQKQAENCANYIGKGSQVAIEGRLQVRTYEGKDGQKRWITEVIAENVRFLDKKEGGGSQKANSLGEEVEINDDEIPF